MPTFHDRRTGEVREVPAEHVDWHARDPEAYINWQASADALKEAGEAMDQVYSRHHETFSWDNPHHYANKK